MRSWLAQSLKTLEEMVDAGELSEDELRAMSRAALVPNNVPSSLLPAALPVAPDEHGEHDEHDEQDRAADDTGVHETRAPASAVPPARKRSGDKR